MTRQPPSLHVAANPSAPRCAGLPGQSIRDLQRLVTEGSSLCDLDCLAHDCYGYLPASHYVNEDGSTTASGRVKRVRPAVQRTAGNARLPSAPAPEGIDGPDAANPFHGLHAADVAEIAHRYRMVRQGAVNPSRSR